MELSKVSNDYLLYMLSSVLNQQEQLYAEKKELEKEISKRNESYRMKYQRGKIKLEIEEYINY